MGLLDKIRENALGITVAVSVLLSSTLWSVPINYKLHKEFNPLFDEAVIVVDLGLQDVVAASKGFNDKSLDDVAEDVYETQRTLGFNHEDMPEFEPYNYNLSRELGTEFWRLTKPYVDETDNLAQKKELIYSYLDGLKRIISAAEGLTLGDEKIFIGSSPFLTDIVEDSDGAYMRLVTAHELGHSYMAEKNPVHDTSSKEINEEESLEFRFTQQIYREGIAEYMAYLTAIEMGDEELAKQIREDYAIAILSDEPLDNMMVPYIFGFNFVKDCVEGLPKEDTVDLINTTIMHPPENLDEINYPDIYLERLYDTLGYEDIIVIDNPTEINLSE